MTSSAVAPCSDEGIRWWKARHGCWSRSLVFSHHRPSPPMLHPVSQDGGRVNHRPPPPYNSLGIANVVLRCGGAFLAEPNHCGYDVPTSPTCGLWLGPHMSKCRPKDLSPGAVD